MRNVDEGHIGPEDFRSFVFDNPVRLWTGGNPAFFEGTVLEDAVAVAATNPH